MVGQSRRHLVAVGLFAVLLALSGCTLPFGGGSSEDPGQTLDETNVTVEEVRPGALSALSAVETYRVNGSTERVFGSPRGPDDPENVVDGREVVTETQVVVNRPNRSLRAEELQRAEGQTVRVRTWVVNETLFARSPAFKGDPDRFRDDYGSEWVVRQPSNFTARWATLDPLTRQRALLSAANLSVAGVHPETGAYVLRGSVSPAAYERAVGGLDGRFAAEDAEYSVTNVTVTFHVDPDTDRVRRFEGEIGLTVPTEQGVIPVTQTVELRYDDYGLPVAVETPDGAPDPAE